MIINIYTSYNYSIKCNVSPNITILQLIGELKKYYTWDIKELTLYSAILDPNKKLYEYNIVENDTLTANIYDRTSDKFF